ncbi:MAG: hypothetical protein NVS1B13_17440 [Flavisolibacter sp.]
MKNYQVVIDPLGNQVYLMKRFIFLTQDNYDAPTDIIPTISTPGIVIEIGMPCFEMHYFKKLGWDATLLISVKKEDDHWNVIECEKNPSKFKVEALIKRRSKVIKLSDQNYRA